MRLLLQMGDNLGEIRRISALESVSLSKVNIPHRQERWCPLEHGAGWIIMFLGDEDWTVCDSVLKVRHTYNFRSTIC